MKYVYVGDPNIMKTAKKISLKWYVMSYINELVPIVW